MDFIKHHRSYSAILHYANRLDLQTRSKTQYIHWTAEEDSLIRRLWPTAQFKNIYKLISRCTDMQIRHRAAQLGVKCYLTIEHAWTEADDSFIKNNLEYMSIVDIADTLHRTTKAVSARIKRLRLVSPRYWTDEQLTILKANYSLPNGIEVCKQLLPNKQLGAIYQKAHALGLDRPTGIPGRKIICVETSIIYENITKAAEQLNINKGTLRNCVSGQSKTAGGYHWKYIEENDKLLKSSH